MYKKGCTLNGNPLSDRTQRTLAIRDRDALSDQWLHVCTVLFGALAHPQAFFAANLSAESDRFAASKAIAAGLDRTVKGVSIPADFCQPLDSLFGLAPSGEGLSVLLSAGSLGYPWVDDPGDGLRVAVFTTPPPQEQHDFLTGKVHYVASAGPDQFTLAGWVPEHLLDFPQSDLPSYLAALRGLATETRHAFGLNQRPATDTVGDDLAPEVAARIAADLGRSTD